MALGCSKLKTTPFLTFSDAQTAFVDTWTWIRYLFAPRSIKIKVIKIVFFTEFNQSQVSSNYYCRKNAHSIYKTFCFLMRLFTCQLALCFYSMKGFEVKYFAAIIIYENYFGILSEVVAKKAPTTVARVFNANGSLTWDDYKTAYAFDGYFASVFSLGGTWCYFGFRVERAQRG